MKIALVHRKYTITGGMERYLVRFSYFLVEEGYDVHVFAASWDKEVDDRITFHQVKCPGKVLGIEQYTFAKNAHKAIAKQNFDIVQTFSRLGFGDIIRTGAGCHGIYKERMLEEIKNPLKRVLKKITSKLSIKDYLTGYLEAQDFKPGNYKKIMAVSTMVKNEIINKYHVYANDIIVNHNGVDIKLFCPDKREKFRQPIRGKYGLNDDDLVLLFVGSEFERKGLKYVIRVLPELRENVKLMVIGKGKINKYKTLARKYGVQDRVIFIGFTTDANIYYSAGDVFVLPSLYDPCANVSLEAMASGLPIITTITNGASGIVIHGKNGFILDKPGDTKSLISYINELVNEAKRRDMSEAARDSMLEYTEKSNYERTITIYRRLLDNPEGKRKE
jgi:UDP-glucose:(heptosyl)LPS alpha-1,3-glucosyltransferase